MGVVIYNAGDGVGGWMGGGGEKFGYVTTPLKAMLLPPKHPLILPPPPHPIANRLWNLCYLISQQMLL